MTTRIESHQLKIDARLHRFIETEALPRTGIDAATFWKGFSDLANELAPKNRALLAERDRLQLELDAWHRANPGPIGNMSAYRAFLESIGYLQPVPAPFKISTANIDTEITEQAGPQLVVPVMNARYALNAANARWGSLYDALYGTDAIPSDSGAEVGTAFNPVRGARVIAFARNFLNQAAPLAQSGHDKATAYAVEGGKLIVSLQDGTQTGLADPAKFAGFQGKADAPSAILLKNNGLHFEIQIDRTHPIGKSDSAGVKDVLMEAALSTIMDCEDSVAAVDAEDKVVIYRNWLGLMNGTLVETLEKGGKTITPGNAPFLEIRFGLVIGRSRDPVVAGGIRDRRLLDRDAPQHLVLHLHDIVWIEESAFLKLRILDFLRGRIERAVPGEHVGL
jgi:malate synthase